MFATHKAYQIEIKVRVRTTSEHIDDSIGAETLKPVPRLGLPPSGPQGRQNSDAPIIQGIPEDQVHEGRAKYS